MKKLLISACAVAVTMVSRADDATTLALLIAQNDGVTQAVALDRVQRMTYSAAGDSLLLNDTLGVALDSIGMVSFGSLPDVLSVEYDGTAARVVNPYFLDGVRVTVSGADVTIANSNTSTEIETWLSGTTTDGSFVYNGTYKTTIALNGLTLTNTRGAAIDIECGKRVALEVRKGTENTLVDGSNGEQKAALYCKGHLEIDKAGTLTVTGNTGHAISAKEYIMLKKSEGTIRVLGAVKDGIHCKQFLAAKGFTVDISGTLDDGIDVEADGEENDEGYADGSLHLLGTVLNITTTADAAKALAADQDIVVNGSAVTVTQSGSYVIDTEEADTSSVAALRCGGSLTLTDGSITVQSSATCGKAISAEADVNLLAGVVQLTMTGQGGKGIKADNNVVIGVADSLTGPTLQVSTSGSTYSWDGSSSSSSSNWGWGGGGPGGGWGGGMMDDSNGTSSKAVKAMGTITVYGGTSTITTSTDGAEGWEGKQGVTIYGGNHYLKCYDDCINAKGIVNIAGGTTVCWSNGNDAVDSNYGAKGAITISGGNLFAYSTKGSPEEGIDCDNNSYIVVTGGIAVSAGGAQNSSTSIGSSTQGYYMGSSPSSYNSTYYYTLCNTSGTPVCTYRFQATCSNSLSLLTAPDLGKGSIKVLYGTARPTACTDSTADMFFIAPTVTTTGTATTITSK